MLKKIIVVCICFVFLGVGFAQVAPRDNFPKNLPGHDSHPNWYVDSDNGIRGKESKSLFLNDINYLKSIIDFKKYGTRNSIQATLNDLKDNPTLYIKDLNKNLEDGFACSGLALFVYDYLKEKGYALDYWRGKDQYGLWGNHFFIIVHIGNENYTVDFTPGYYDLMGNLNLMQSLQHQKNEQYTQKRIEYSKNTDTLNFSPGSDDGIRTAPYEVKNFGLYHVLLETGLMGYGPSPSQVRQKIDRGESIVFRVPAIASVVPKKTEIIDSLEVAKFTQFFQTDYVKIQTWLDTQGSNLKTLQALSDEKLYEVLLDMVLSDVVQISQPQFEGSLLESKDLANQTQKLAVKAAARTIILFLQEIEYWAR